MQSKWIRLFLLSCLFLLFLSAACNQGASPLSDGEATKNLPSNWPWRGVNLNCGVGSNITEWDIKNIKQHELNMVHILLNPPRARSKSSANEVFDLLMQETEQILEYCKKYELTAVVSFHKFPFDPSKNFRQSSTKFWYNPEEVKTALSFFEQGVKRLSRYGNELAAYEFISEPILRDSKEERIPKNVREVTLACIEIVQRHDKGRYFCISPGPGGHPSGYKDFEPYAADNLVYNFHFFGPNQYTHQGINNSAVLSYPGIINNRKWNQERMKAVMRPALNWKASNEVLMTLGSFGCTYWADGRLQYLSDLVNIAKAHGLSYSYHCYNGFPAWSLVDKNHVQPALRKMQQRLQSREIPAAQKSDNTTAHTWKILNPNE